MSEIKPARVGTRALWLMCGLPLAAVVASVWGQLHSFWSGSDTYSHGYLVVAVAGWLAHRGLRTGVRGDASMLGFICLGGALSSLLIARAAEVLLVQFAAVALLPLTTIWAVAGWKSARRFLEPTAFTIFAIPIWDLINEPLRFLTTTVVGQLTYMVQIPAFIVENTIQIPSGTFHIEGGCAGLHYFIVACALGFLHGVLNYAAWRARLAAVVVAAGLALLANWLRVFVIIVAGHLTDMRHFLVTVDHYYFGWLLFSLVMAGALWFGRNIGRSGDPTAAATSTVSSLDVPTIKADVLTAMTAGALIVAAVLSAQLTVKRGLPIQEASLDLPRLIGSWELGEAWVGPDQPIYAGAAASAGAWYRHAGQGVGVFVARYPIQRQGAEAVYYANKPFGEGARIVARSRVLSAAGAAEPFTELEVIDADLTSRLVWYGFKVGGRRTASEIGAKALQVLAAMWNRWDATVVVLTARCEQSCDQARVTLHGITAALDIGSLSTLHHEE